MPDQSRNVIRSAPVTSLTTAESVVGAALTFLATHHVLGDIDVSATTQTVAPFVALVLPAVFGAVKWRLVTPAAKVEDLLERAGLITDADLARIGAIIDDRLQDAGWDRALADQTDSTGSRDSTDAAAASAHQAEHTADDGRSPHSMAAGA